MSTLPKYLAAILLAGSLLAGTLRLEADPPQSFACPPYLQQGDTVAIVSPAARIRNKKIAEALEEIGSWGLHVKCAPNYDNMEQAYLAGTDEERAADLQWAIDDPSVKAIIACQGGYGSVRILPLVDLEPLKRNPKWIAGFSDITMLHLALRRLEIQSIHSTMPSQFLPLDDSLTRISNESLRQALFGLPQSFETEPHPMNRPGSAEGILTGGNLMILSSAAGTPEALDNDRPAILIIEEINEQAYRLDRMMQQLLRSGALKSVTAIVAGHFTGIGNTNLFDEPCSIIRRYADLLDVPLMFGFPLGHDKPNMAVYLGRAAEVTITEEGASLRFSDL